MPTTVRSLAPTDRASIDAVLRSDATFRNDEIAVALELVDDALARPDHDYWVRVALDDAAGGAVLGYICFGPTPMTQSQWDLYWVATAAAARGRGVASALVAAMETELRRRGAGGVRIETSPLDGYGTARRLYERFGYVEVGHIADFYQPGDDLITYHKRL